jgi:hypothetical protein
MIDNCRAGPHQINTVPGRPADAGARFAANTNSLWLPRTGRRGYHQSRIRAGRNVRPEGHRYTSCWVLVFVTALQAGGAEVLRRRTRRKSPVSASTEREIYVHEWQADYRLHE